MGAASFLSMAGIISTMGYAGGVYLMGWTGGFVLLSLLLAPSLRKFGRFRAAARSRALHGGKFAC
jgi:cation/acetate symporter